MRPPRLASFCTLESRGGGGGQTPVRSAVGSNNIPMGTEREGKTISIIILTVSIGGSPQPRL